MKNKELKLLSLQLPMGISIFLLWVFMRPTLVHAELSKAMTTYCAKIDAYFEKYKWGKSNCESYQWNHVRNSVAGDPLSWVVFGHQEPGKDKKIEATMIMCGVHGDEITPIKFCFDILTMLKNSPALYEGKSVIVAPIVCPDSFFINKPTRTNANKVDINRNFPTKDWHSHALKYWSTRYSKDPRRFPGSKPLTEPEVVFQVNLIKRYAPDKILSVHAPLTMLDYDGPSDLHSHEVVDDGANELLIQMAQKAKGYRIIDFPHYPGSLGNYAGNELKIPTYTLELPSSDPAKNEEYWVLFKDAITEAITKDLKRIKDTSSTVQPSSSETVGQSKAPTNEQGADQTDQVAN